MEQKFSLNGLWSIHKTPDDPDVPSVVEYIPAQVPGNIQKDLENAQRLPRLWYGEVDPKLYEAATHDWWYEREFDVPAEWSGKRITLDFEDVDYGCEVFVNGQAVGSHRGMFERFYFDVGCSLRFGEKNKLAVRIEKMPDEFLKGLIASDGPYSHDENGYSFLNVNDELRNALKGMKSPANMSYDWGTNVYTLGIWKDVTLRCTGDVRIDWVFFKPVFKDHDTSRSTVEFSVEADSLTAGSIDMKLSVEKDGKELTALVPCELKKGANLLTGSIEVEHPELWWPAGYGGQPLYNGKVELAGSDCFADRFAFRDIWWTDCEGAPENYEYKYQLVLNGVKIRTMGSCVTAMDLLFGTIGDRGIHYVEMAKNCGMTMLRLHGGQIVYPKSFYDAADEEGIMLSAEFPIANGFIDNDPELLDALDVTYKNIINQLRNHPSIIEWGGGNEMPWFYYPDVDRTGMYRQEAAVYDQDDSRLYRYTCPAPGSRHSSWTYDPGTLYELYESDLPDNWKSGPSMRYGEFGVQTPSNAEVWYRDVPPADRWPVNCNDPVLTRKNAVSAIFGPDWWLGKREIDRFFGYTENVDDMIRGGQFLAAEGLRYACDALRAREGRIGGFTNWDYNEPWPNCAGSFLVDYDGRAVMAFYGVKEALAPISLCMKYDTCFYSAFHNSFAELRVNSDSLTDNENLTWAYTAFDRKGRVFDFDSGKVNAEYRKTVNLGKVQITPPDECKFSPVFFYLTLKNADGEIISERVHVFPCDGAENALAGLLTSPSVGDSVDPADYDGIGNVSVRFGGPVKKTTLACRLADYTDTGICETSVIEVENTGDMMALFVEVTPRLEYQGDWLVDRNFVSVPAGEKREITITSMKHRDTVNLLKLSQVGFVVRAFNSEETLLDPDASMMLYCGRKDQTNRFFLQEERSGQEFTAETPCLDSAKVSYLLRDHMKVSFHADSNHAAQLIMVLADHENSGLCRLTASVNDHAKTYVLHGGLGMQDKEPWHLGYPETYVLDLPEDVLKSGENELTLEVSRGFVTWDFLCIREK